MQVCIPPQGHPDSSHCRFSSNIEQRHKESSFSTTVPSTHRAEEGPQRDKPDTQTSWWDQCTGRNWSQHLLGTRAGIGGWNVCSSLLTGDNAVTLDALPSDPHVTVSLQPADCMNKSRGREASLLFSLSDADHGDPVVTRV